MPAAAAPRRQPLSVIPTGCLAGSGSIAPLTRAGRSVTVTGLARLIHHPAQAAGFLRSAMHCRVPPVLRMQAALKRAWPALCCAPRELGTS